MFRLAPEDRAQRLGDLARRDGPGRDLVEQRLEEVEVAPVDEGDLDPSSGRARARRTDRRTRRRRSGRGGAEVGLVRLMLAIVIANVPESSPIDSSDRCSPSPPRSTTIDAGRPAPVGLRSSALLGARLLTKDIAFPAAGAPGLRARPAPAGPGGDDRGAGRPRTGAPPPLRTIRLSSTSVWRRSRIAMRRSSTACSSSTRGAPAHRLHPDGRAGLPGVQPYRPADPADCGSPPATSTGSRSSSATALRRRPPDRRHRQRADPRPRRPGRRRHGDPGRQARPLHRRGGHPSRR